MAREEGEVSVRLIEALLHELIAHRTVGHQCLEAIIERAGGAGDPVLGPMKTRLEEAFPNWLQKTDRDALPGTED